MGSDVSAREKWELFLRGDDVGPMVSPLCDNWSLDVPYHWPYDEPEPFREGHPSRTLGEQIAMAGVCGWDPTFLAAIPFTPRDPALRPQVTTGRLDCGGTRAESVVHTPYGDLTSVVEQKVSSHVVKAELACEEDYRRKAWAVRRGMDYDEDGAIAAGQELARAVGDKGVLGTWFGPPAMALNHNEMHYHLADFPDAVLELRAAVRQAQFKQIETLRKAGFDYLFYCVDGTEWVSPSFFAESILPDTLVLFGRWRKLGGFILWHSCGHVARLLERGFYNQCRPEIFETLSEPPVGNLPSLAWAQQRLDQRIATKGNIPLGVLLNGTEEQVREEVRRVREQTRGTRHIVGLSDDVLANTPLANARALVDEARRR